MPAAHSAAAMGRLDDAGTSRARVSSATSSATSSSSSDATGSTQTAAELPDDRRLCGEADRDIGRGGKEPKDRVDAAWVALPMTWLTMHSH